MASRRQFVLIAVAIGAAALPRPADGVEWFYAHGLYPPLQAALTGVSNLVPVAMFDVMVVVATALIAWWWGRALVESVGARRWRPLGRAGMTTVTLAAGLYLWFVLAWGLNYARPPIEQRLALPSAAPTAVEVGALLDEAVSRVNALYQDSRAEGFVPYRAETDVARALHAVEARHGRPRATVPGTPKPTLLAPYFRMAGVDGLTAPLALETLLNPDLTRAERPFTLAHEWAHLSGHAAEADANYVAWLVTQEAGTWAQTQYSGWLFLVSEAARQVPADRRRLALAALGGGPRQDLADIAARLRSRVDVVERVGWRVYDSYLRSQGVDDGVRSYSRVVTLIVQGRRTVRNSDAEPRDARPR